MHSALMTNRKVDLKQYTKGISWHTVTAIVFSSLFLKSPSDKLHDSTSCQQHFCPDWPASLTVHRKLAYSSLQLSVSVFFPLQPVLLHLSRSPLYACLVSEPLSHCVLWTRIWSRCVCLFFFIRFRNWSTRCKGFRLRWAVHANPVLFYWTTQRRKLAHSRNSSHDLTASKTLATCDVTRSMCMSTACFLIIRWLHPCSVRLVFAKFANDFLIHFYEYITLCLN